MNFKNLRAKPPIDKRLEPTEKWRVKQGDTDIALCMFQQQTTEQRRDKMNHPYPPYVIYQR